ncbi:MAG: hypothetical protein ACLRRT_14835 [Ruthenibacterium lactatiformans]
MCLRPRSTRLAGQLEAETAAADIEAAPEGVTAAPAGKLQAVLNGLRDLVKAHTDRADNPRGDGGAGGAYSVLRRTRPSARRWWSWARRHGEKHL